MHLYTTSFLKRGTFLLIATALFIGLLSFSSTVNAQEEQPLLETEKMITVATVNIYDARISSQEGNDFLVSFDISNREGVQPDIRYGVQLRTPEGGIVDTKVFDETVSLGQNETVSKTVLYTVPDTFSGPYELWVISQNSSGLLLSFNKAADIELSGSVKSLKIDTGTCFVTLPLVEENYALNAGVDLSATDEATFSCEVNNAYAEEKVVAAKFVTYRRTVFGEVVGESISEQKQTLAPSETKRLDFIIPKQSAPQSYETTFTLVDEGGKALSGEINFRYVIHGSSATIQNVTLDKTAYSAGEQAEVFVFWSPSADNFPDARHGATTLPENKVVFSLSLMSDGKACAETVKKEFAEATDAKNLVPSFSVAVTADCPNPTAEVSIADVSGNILDTKDYSFEGADTEVVSDNNSKMSYPVLVAITLIGIILLIILLMVVRKKKDVTMLLFLIIATGVFFGTAPSAQADTYAISNGTVTANLNKALYNANETVTASVSAATFFCANASDRLSVTTAHNGGGASTVFDTNQPYIYNASCPAIYDGPYWWYPFDGLNISISTCNASWVGFESCTDSSNNGVYCTEDTYETVWTGNGPELQLVYVHHPVIVGSVRSYVGTHCGSERCNESWSGSRSYSATAAYPGNQGKVTVTGTQYGENYTVAAFDLWYTVAAAIPSVPSGLSATANATCGTGQINLSWNSVSGATSYTVRDGSTVVYTGASTSFSHTGLANGSSHSYSVSATNGAGSSAYSSTVSATTAAACVVVPATPTGLNATPNATCGTGQISVSWNSVSGATSYTLRDGATVIYTGGSTSFSHTGLANGSSHSYTVRANNGAGSSAYSSASNGTVSAACALPPTTPTGLNAIPSAVCGAGQISISWNSVSGATSYTVRDGATVIYTGGSTSFSHTGLANGSSHSYTVRANNGAGSSAYSAVVNASAASACTLPPVTPTNFTATPDAMCGSGNINLAWDASVGAIGYDLQIDGGAWFNVGNVTSYAHTGLVDGSSHTYYLRAWNGVGAGVQTTQRIQTAPSSCVGPSVLLTVSDNDITVGNSVTLTWTTANVVSCTSAGDWSGAKNPAGDTESVTPLSTGVKIYRINCEDGAGNPTGEQALQITVNPAIATAATIIPSVGCSISTGSSTCNQTYTWTITNGNPAYEVINIKTGIALGTADSDTKLTTLDWGSNTIEARHNNGDLVDSITVTAACTSGAAWSAVSSTCEPAPPLINIPIDVTANPNLIRSGNTAEIAVEIDTVNPMSCTMLNAQAATVPFTHDGTPSLQTHTFTTRPLTAAQVVTVNCVGTVDPNVVGTGETRVNVVGILQEV